MSKQGVLVLGPGWVAGEHIKAYCRSDDTEVRSIVGTLPRDRQAAEAYGRDYGLQADYSQDLDSELSRSDIDIVSVCVINHLHFAATLKAIRAGKHVLVEKPLCFSMEQLRTLRAAEQEYGTVTMVGHVVRWYTAVAAAHALVRDKKLGTIFYGESDYWHEVHGDWKTRPDTAGSSLLMGGCHSVDLLRWFMGMERRVVEVHAYSNGPFRRSDFAYPPNVTGILRFHDGAMGKIGSSLETSMPYVLHFQFMGTLGCIRNQRYFLTSWGDKSDVGFRKIDGRLPDDPNVTHHPFPEEIQYFVDCVKAQREPDLSIRNVYHTYEIVFALDLSARTGLPVTLPLKSDSDP